MTDIRTSVPVPTKPWETARTRFLIGLSDAEVYKFQNANLENLFHDATAAQQRFAHGSKTWELQARLASLTEGIEDYGRALDLYANGFSLIMCPLWGSIRVLLHVFSEAGKFQAMMVDMLAQIGDILPRYRVYQKLFGNHERLLVALSETYLDVFQYCIRVKEFFFKARKSYIPLSIVLKGAWRPFRKDFENDVARLRMHSKTVEKEVFQAHCIESAKARALEDTRRALQKQNATIKRRHGVLSSLPAVDYKGKHSKQSLLHCAGTGSWIRSHPSFTSWLSAAATDCLPIYGIPGSGKSVLAASIADELLRSDTNSTSFVCYYYFDYSDLTSLDPVTFIASMMKQVLVMLPLDRFDESFKCPFQEAASTPNLQNCLSYLIGLFHEYKTVYIVLDGLDALPFESKPSVLGFLESIISRSPATMKLLVTCRIGDSVVQRSFASYSSISMNATCIQDDIDHFIDSQLDLVVKQNLLLANERLRQEVRKALANGAQGMFLWVKFQLYSIQEAITEAQLRLVLSDLPKSLAETYLKMLEATFASGGIERIDLMKKAFRWIASARRPLLIHELEEAVGLDKTDTFLHTDRTAAGAGDQLLRACGYLIVHNNTDRSITFAHHTIQQFLCSTLTEQGIALHPASTLFDFVRIDMARTKLEIGEICIAYLSFADFETQLARAPKSTQIERREIERVIWGQIPLGSFVRGCLSWGRTKGKAADETFEQIAFTHPTRISPSEILVKKYALLDYIVDYWPFHTQGFNKDLPCWLAFKNIALHRLLMFEHRPWREENHRSAVTKHVNRLKTGGCKMRCWSDAVNNEVCKEAVLMYTWAMAHDVKALLLLAKDLNLIHYFTEAYTDRGLLCHRRASKLLATITTSTMPTGTRVWSGDFIYRFVRYNCTSNNNGISDLDESLAVLKSEMLTWRRMDSPTYEQLLREAMLHCLNLGDDETFCALLKYDATSAEKLATLLITAVKAGHLRKEPITHILCHFVDGIIPEETMFELAFALDHCLIIVNTLVFNSADSTLSIQPELLWLIRILTLITPGYLALATHLIANHPTHHPVRCDKIFHLPKKDWCFTTLGTRAVYKRLRRIHNLDLLAIAFVQARRDLQTSALEKHTTLEKQTTLEPLPLAHHRIITTLAQCLSKRMRPCLYEYQGVHCLNWALDWDLAAAMPLIEKGYAAIIRSARLGTRRGTVVRNLLLGVVEGGAGRIAQVMTLPWPHEIVVDVLGRVGAGKDGAMMEALRSLKDRTLVASWVGDYVF